MSNKTKKKQIENQAQQGRSMVEMLGVLAIIGVLSIGGIAGYRMAMNRYQANQIANEINLMRTDAKMKVARGVELLLGEPYDGEDGHLKFNESYGVEVDSSVIISDGEEGREEGYSFTLFGIPAGVCKPLTTLLWGMDDTASLKINEGYYDDETTENKCEEENEIEVAFSTKDIGGVGSGSSNPEVTDPEQGDQPQADDSVPEECPRGTTLSDDGSECTCEDTEKTCNGGCCAGCTGGKVWNGKKCACPAGAEPSEDGEECACSTAKPHWNGTECTACPNGSTWDSTTGECKCEGNKVWKESVSGEDKCVELVGECESNADCGPGEYCYMCFGNSCTQEFKTDKFGGNGSDKSECRNARKDIKDGKAGEKSGFIIGKPDEHGGTMNWWSAGRFCEALGRKQATLASIGCSDVPYGERCQSETRKNLYDDFGSYSVKMYDMHGSCLAYSVAFDTGHVGDGILSSSNLALCE